MKNKKVCVIGQGYIGLPTSAILASSGFEVIGVDKKTEVVKSINNGKIHIVEPELDKLVLEVVKQKKLRASEVVEKSDIYIICVPTPFIESDSDIKHPNIEYVLSAAEEISIHIKNNDFVIIESTSPLGTTEKVHDLIRKRRPELEKIHFAYCPERVLPGNIIYEMVNNSRIIGGLSDESTKLISEFYRSFVKGEVIETSSQLSEMCKLTENSFRDVNISFANELSMICSSHNLDVWKLISLANRHPRVNILQPGPGVGGHCIAVDPWFIVSNNPENSRIIKTAREINDQKPYWVVKKIKDNLKGISSPKVLCLGLAFKPDIDDLRESPALNIVKQLKNNDFNIACLEPNILKHDQFQLVDMSCNLEDYDLVVLLVKHKEFLSESFKQKLRKVNALDFCGVLQDNL